MSPLTLIRWNRLLLFGRLVGKVPHSVMRVLLAVRDGAKSWMRAVQNDLAWLTISTHAATCKGWSINHWITYAIDEPKGFRQLVYRFCHSSFANLDIHWAVTKSLRQIGQSWSCPECRKEFSSKQGLAVHKYKIHGVKRLERIYI